MLHPSHISSSYYLLCVVGINLIHNVHIHLQEHPEALDLLHKAEDYGAKGIDEVAKAMGVGQVGKSWLINKEHKCMLVSV